MEYFERIIDATTGTETIRPFTDEEIARQKALEAEHAKAFAEQQAEKAAKDAEKERIAAALGLSVEELKVLLS